MEAYFDIQYGQDEKRWGIVYDFIPYGNHMEIGSLVQLFQKVLIESLTGISNRLISYEKHMEA